MIKTSYILGGILLFSLLGMVSALEATQVISNSERWEDVYSTILYASLTGIEGNFLTGTEHGPLLLNSIPTSHDIGIITSNDYSFVFDYTSIVEQRGYSSVEELEYDDVNLGLIEELPDIDSFIIVGHSYGYSAIAVTPYAKITNSWVFLADRTNIAEIESILDARDAQRVLIFGYVDREVHDALVRFNPEEINTGDRFQDNVEIVKKFLEQEDTRQVLLSNGEFIERELMRGIHPVLFTGRENVPVKIADYLKKSNISVGVLIGNELINAATNIRRDTGISVMVKFAQGARSQTSGVSAVEGLDLFYLPTPTLNLEVMSAKYNAATSQIELTYHSTSNVPIYLKGELTLNSEEGRKKVGDSEPIFIGPGDYKTLRYPDVVLTGEEPTARLYTLFGEVPTSLDRALSADIKLSRISVLDNCEIEVDYVKYVKQSENFIIKVENLEDADCYVDIELENIIINNVKQTIGTDGSQYISAGDSEKIVLKQRMDAIDLEDNVFVNLAAYYGEREDSLVKSFRGKFELDIDYLTGMTYLILVVILLILLILFILYRMKKRDEW